MEELKDFKEITLNNYMFILLVNSSDLDVNIKENIIRTKYNENNDYVILSFSEFSALFKSAKLNNDDSDLILTNALINSYKNEDIKRK